MKAKPEDKHFKGNGGVLRTAKQEQRKGSGKKIGSPLKAIVKSES